MNNNETKQVVRLVKASVAFVAIAAIIAGMYSFTAKRIGGDFLDQLGIVKEDAEKKISNSMLGGYLDAYGLRNAKNIAVGNRAAVVKDLLVYSKNYVNSDAFKKEYAVVKERNKPSSGDKIQTPEEMKAGLIKNAKESIQQLEESLKKATPDTKSIIEEILKSAKQNLKDAEDPGNPYIKMYADNYDAMVKSSREMNEVRLKEWEKEYPTSHLVFVKKRLQQFMVETKDVDFKAAVADKNGRKFFVEQTNERKSNRWKMAFRAGKEVVEPARAFVQAWINEIG